MTIANKTKYKGVDEMGKIDNKTNANFEQTVNPFGIRDKAGYLFGDLGNDFAFMFTSMYLMVFYTKVLGIDASLVGLLFLIARFIDACTDIAMGTVIDKSNPSKDGKFRPWIKKMSGPLALMTFLMYQSSLASAPMTFKIIFMFITYILWGSVFYTAINIPYGSMTSAITEVPEERATLSTWRNMGASIASIVIGSITPFIIYYTDANGNQIVDPDKFTMIAGIFSLLSFIFYMLCYKLTTERVKFDIDNSIDNKKEEKVSIFKNLSIVLKNKALLALIASSITMLLSMFMGQSMNQYLFLDYFKDISALSTLSLVGLPIGLMVATIIVKLSSKYGKKEVSAIGMFIAGGAYLVGYILKFDNPWYFIVMYAISQIGLSFCNMLTYANISDISDYHEILTGKREDGVIYGLYSFARKIGQALAGGLGGFALSLIGYNSMVSIQTTEVTNGIYTLSTLFPAICYIATGLIFVFGYPLTKKMVEENSKKLSEMRKTK